MTSEKIKDLLYILKNEFENEIDENYKSDYKNDITDIDFKLMTEFLERFLNKANLVIDYEIKKDNLISDAYKLTFEDAVKCYLEGLNYVGNEKNVIDLTEEEIKKIAYRLIYKNEYMWEIINETIKIEIDDILKERKNN